MASRGWGKNKKGVLVNSAGKTALEVRLDKYASKLKARKEKLAAKKAEAKAKAKSSGGGGADDDFDFAGLEEAIKSQPKKRGRIKQGLKYESTPEEKAMADALFGKEGRAAVKAKIKEGENFKKNSKQSISRGTKGDKEDKKEAGMLEKTDVGTQKFIYTDEISIKNPKKFNEAKLNEAAELIKKEGWNYDAVVIKETGANRYEVIGNAFVYEAAKRAGIERINTVIGNDKAEQNLKASRDDEPETLTVGPQKDRASKRYNMEDSDIGTMKITYLDEIDVKPTQRVNPKKVAETAERMKQGKTNWEPIPIRETGPDRYEIVGNAHLYEAAKQAGLERVKTIMVGDQTKEHKLGGKSKRKR